ncbi:hypothetical protein ACMD2_09412 [Ananas comosus]|uniref:UspA domain-containing protein n=1 Tax=Ananas comosus TaxID=4615 RepID=A0A199W6S1_ANACO|nr:hypothetical protein ACMD2_09412 [Ananas comosus]
MATGNLGCVVVAVDSSEESMKALRWALDNSARRSRAADPGGLIILHVQPAPSSPRASPGSIPFAVEVTSQTLVPSPLFKSESDHVSCRCGVGDVDVPAFSAAIEAHQRRITDAILKTPWIYAPIETGGGRSEGEDLRGHRKLARDLLVMGVVRWTDQEDVLRKCEQLLHQPCKLPSSRDKGNMSSFSTVFAVVVLAFELRVHLPLTAIEVLALWTAVFSVSSAFCTLLICRYLLRLYKDECGGGFSLYLPVPRSGRLYDNLFLDFLRRLLLSFVGGSAMLLCYVPS